MNGEFSMMCLSLSLSLSLFMKKKTICVEFHIKSSSAWSYTNSLYRTEYGQLSIEHGQWTKFVRYFKQLLNHKGRFSLQGVRQVRSLHNPYIHQISFLIYHLYPNCSNCIRFVICPPHENHFRLLS